MKKTWQLDYKDKAIHRHMSFAANQLRKVARLLREYKANSTGWQKHADVIESSAELMDIWRKVIRSEKQNNPQIEVEE